MSTKCDGYILEADLIDMVKNILKDPGQYKKYNNDAVLRNFLICNLDLQTFLINKKK